MNNSTMQNGTNTPATLGLVFDFAWQHRHARDVAITLNHFDHAYNYCLSGYTAYKLHNIVRRIKQQIITDLDNTPLNLTH